MERPLDQKPEEYSLEYAGFWIRLGAGVIDLAIVLSLIYSVSSIIGGITSRLTSALVASPAPFCGYASIVTNAVVIARPADDNAINALLIIPVAALIAAIYMIGMWVWRGQTLGKMVLGIKIIRTDSSPLDLNHAIIRCGGGVVAMAMLGIGFIWIAFDSRKQGIHDKIADTYVVKLPVRQVIFTQSYIRGHVGQT
jgi:uncharacterized RDD family membrane protein YckC